MNQQYAVCTKFISDTIQERFPWWLVVENLLAKAGDAGSIPHLGRSPREGNGNPLQYSCLGNATDGRA